MEIIQHLDTSILIWIQETLRNDLMTRFWVFITSLGDGGFWTITGILLLCFKRTRRTGIMALISLVICSLLTNQILKNLFDRPRPFQEIIAVIPLIRKPMSYSFPSGHTSSSFAAALIYYRMLPKRYGIPTLILAGMIGFSRVYLGVHYPSDVLGGIVVAIIGSMAAYYVVQSELI